MINFQVIILALLFLFALFLITLNYTSYFSKVDLNVNSSKNSKDSNWYLVGLIKIENGRILELTFQNLTGNP
ncbi:MAG: hypothetical protein QW156_03130 [Candidatus Aenigmatarchaeota archaeon]